MPEKLADAILSNLQYNSFLVTLLLAGQGVALSRIWPEGEPRPGWNSLIRLVPGFGCACYCIYELTRSYIGLTKAISHQTIPSFASNWMNGYWYFYLVFAAGIFFTVVSSTMVRTRKVPKNAEGSSADHT